MVRYSFEVWTEVHKTVEIEADNRDDAFEKMSETLYGVDMSDATETTDRTYVLVDVED